MFMTNYELVYGKRKFSSNASNTLAPTEYHSTTVIQSEESDIAENSKTGFMQSAVGFMKSDEQHSCNMHSFHHIRLLSFFHL